MKKLIITCSVLFLAGTAFAQTKESNAPKTQAQVAANDPMAMNPLEEVAMNKAEAAELKGPNGAELNMDQKVDKIIERLEKTCSLTAIQKDQIRPMILNSQIQKEQMLKGAKGSAEQAMPMLHQINLQRAQMLHQVLTPLQWEKYVQMRKDLAAKGAAMSTTPATK